MMAASDSDDRPFRSAAPYYARGRLPYAASLADTLAGALALDGRGRLLDIGCGPGILALQLAHLFDEVVGLDIEPEMLAEADRSSQGQRVTRAHWLRAQAEDLPFAFSIFRLATFGRSLHWMDHKRLAPAVFEVLEPGGALVVLFEARLGSTSIDRVTSPTLVPRDAIQELLQRYLGASLAQSGHDARFAILQDVPPILARAGFSGPKELRAESRELLVRTADDIVAAYYSRSSSAPALFGNRLTAFEADLRRLLAEASPSGLFSEQITDTQVLAWCKPGDRPHPSAILP